MFPSKMYLNSLYLLLLFIGNIVAAPYVLDRVVNGIDTKISDNPFMLSLRDVNGYHSCGATLISNEWALTAAHCIGSLDPDLYTLQYGVTVIQRDGQTISKVAKVIKHEHYTPSNQYINDIALIKLAVPLELNDSVATVKLPEQDQYTPGGTIGRLLGWGLNGTGGILQENLQHVDLIVVSKMDCAQIHLLTIHKSNICAGVPEGGKGQCSGDSGGPLMVNGAQVGIVSWSMKPCTIAPYPGVYTEVASFRNWIRENTGV